MLTLPYFFILEPHFCDRVLVKLCIRFGVIGGNTPMVRHFHNIKGFDLGAKYYERYESID